MTTNYHTAIATGADAAAATFNAPLGALDAAIGTLATTVSGKAAAVHTHAIADVTSLQTTLDGKAAAVHTHDDRYYTESETDTLLSGKAAAVHTHAIGDVTSLQTTLNGKAASVHTHGAADVTAGTFGAGAYTFTTSVSAPVIVGTNAAAATEGANAISNGTFDSDTSWTAGTGWSIAGGVATKSAGTAAVLAQAVSGIAANQMVRVRFDYTRSAGTLSVVCGGATYGATFSSASASIDIYILTTGTGTLQFSGDASFAGTVDNVQATIITPRTLAVQLPTIGTGNVSAGANALENVTTGARNTALGVEAGRYITTAVDNVAIGYRALGKNRTGGTNVAIGTEALRDASIGGVNQAVETCVAIGYQALASLVFNHSNVAIGASAGGDATSIYNSVMVGRQAGRSGSSNSVMLGAYAGYSETGGNRLYISNTTTTTPLIYGLFSGTGAGVTIYSQETNGTPLNVRAKASQTNDLQRWQNSSGTALSVVTADGAVGVKSATVATSTALEIGGTDAVLLPRLTTTQRDALTAADGMIVYNTTAAKLQARAGGAWVDLH